MNHSDNVDETEDTMGSSLALVQRGPVPPSLVPEQAFSLGFAGMATEPFPDSVTSVLLAPVDSDAIEIKPDGIVYLPGVHVRNRLNAAFKPGAWALAPRGPGKLEGNTVMYHGALFALGRFVSEAIGECEYRANNANMSYAAALEGARTDCLSRCCKDIGIGAELWDPGWREKWIAAHADKEWVESDKPGAKGKWHWFRKDRPVPWQVVKARKAKGVRTPEPAPANSQSQARPQHVTRKASDVLKPNAAPKPPAKAPPGPAKIAAAEVQKIRSVLKDDLQWAIPHITNWLKKHFEVQAVADLTEAQAQTIREIAMAQMLSDEQGEAAMVKAREQGRCK